MSESAQKMFGEWNKITSTECSQKYPDVLTLKEGRAYLGRNEKPGTFAHWDVGTYDLVGTRQFKASTANDAIETYDYKLDKHVLTFTDSQGCVFSYKKAG